MAAASAASAKTAPPKPLLEIRLERPLQDEIVDLISQSDAHAAKLYPPESRHRAELEELAHPPVRVFVARREGTALGCLALALGEGRAA
jgi:putative acetyltransferase